MAKKKLLTTDEWVKKLNTIGLEMDIWCAALHPSAWDAQNASLMAEYRELAAAETYDPPDQLELDL